MKITADHIKKLIRNKHSKDFSLEECKTGPTWGNSNMRKFDMWVMRKSWSKMSCIGYEIKVSRSDFLQDNKWHEYLDYCNEFSFVCPTGLIYPEEMQEGIGLYYVSKTGTKLFCKRKPAFTNKPIPVEIFLYILMCRVVVQENAYSSGERESKKQYWKRWLEKKEINRNFGWMVSKSIRSVVDEKVIKVKHDNDVLTRKIEKYDSFENALEKLGFTINSINDWHFENRLEEKLKEIKSSIPQGIDNMIDRTVEHLGVLKDKLYKDSNKHQ
jgi:hypothetical protein